MWITFTEDVKSEDGHTVLYAKGYQCDVNAEWAQGMIRKGHATAGRIDQPKSGPAAKMFSDESLPEPVDSAVIETPKKKTKAKRLTRTDARF